MNNLIFKKKDWKKFIKNDVLKVNNVDLDTNTYYQLNDNNYNDNHQNNEIFFLSKKKKTFRLLNLLTKFINIKFKYI